MAPFSVRIVWVVSSLRESTPPGCISFEEDGTPKVLKFMENYMQSKAGGQFLAKRFANRLGDKGILSVVSRLRLDSKKC
jgi:retinol dehydrogenase-12